MLVCNNSISSGSGNSDIVHDNGQVPINYRRLDKMSGHVQMQEAGAASHSRAELLLLWTVEGKFNKSSCRAVLSSYAYSSCGCQLTSL